MTKPQRIASFLSANKQRGEQLWILTQKQNLTPSDKLNIETLTKRVEDSYLECFGVLPDWK